jgi:hypothetical protein
MHLKNGRSTGNGAYARKGTALRVMVASRPKVIFFDKMEAPVLEVMDGALYYVCGGNLLQFVVIHRLTVTCDFS